MAARSTFAGALSIAGFPFNFRAFNAISSVKNESFKTLCKCHGEPIAQRNTCATTGAVLDEVDKGVPHGAGFHALPDATIESIKAVGKSVVLEPKGFPLVSTVPLTLATGSFRITHDPKVPGSDAPVATLWRVLHKTGRALVTEWTPRAGSPDAILVIHADDDGLLANTLPWAVELTGAPVGECPTTVVPDAQVAMFEQAITTLYSTDPFDLNAHASAYKERRAKAIEAALDGKEPVAAPEPEAAPVPDLMAALKASLAAVQTKEPIAA